jgi:hypothetical protein
MGDYTGQPTRNIFAAVDFISDSNAADLDSNDDLDCDGYMGAPAVAFYAAVAGDVVVETVFGNTKTIPVAGGQIVPLQIRKLVASDAETTATGLVCLFNVENRNRQS